MEWESRISVYCIVDAGAVDCAGGQGCTLDSARRPVWDGVTAVGESCGPWMYRSASACRPMSVWGLVELEACTSTV